MADPGLEWSEDNQNLIERFLILATGRNMHLGKTNLKRYGSRRWCTGQEVQTLMRELFSKPDLVVKAWNWTDRDDSVPVEPHDGAERRVNP